MADISSLKSIMYTEKSLKLRESGVLVVHASTDVTKCKLRHIFRDYFGFSPSGINSLRQRGKLKRFKGRNGKRPDYKRFYVRVPVGADLGSFSV